MEETAVTLECFEVVIRKVPLISKDANLIVQALLLQVI